MSTVKFIIAFAVVIGCFSTMYPRFIHPFIKRAFGGESPKPRGHEQEAPFQPPNRPPMPPRDGADMRHHMRPGPHPGMRAAADMQRQQGSQGSGRGMMGVVLPMYAVGIVLYLVYTLVKVFNKRDEYKNKRATYSVKDERMYDRQEPPEYENSSKGIGNRVGNFLGLSEGHRELEDLMCKADDKTITGEEMRVLQQRLAETEQQMASILKAMQLVQNKIPEVTEEKSAGKSEVEITDITENNDSKESSIAKSSDSSPDMGSFEIVKTASNSGSNASSIPDEETTPVIEAETIQAKSVEEGDDVGINTLQPSSGDSDDQSVDKSVTSASDKKETVEILKDKESEEKEGLDMRKRQGREYQDN